MVFPIFKRTTLPLLSNLFLKEVKGLQNIPKYGPFMIASNHVSFLDPFLLAYFVILKTNKKVHYLTRKGRFSYLGNNIITNWAGAILFKDDNQEISTALNNAVKILRKGGIVGIFPAAASNDLTRPKTGVARIIIEAKCPIIPAIIKGTDEIMPLYTFIPRRFRHATLEYKKPITFKNSEKNIKLISHKIANVIQQGLNEN